MVADVTDRETCNVISNSSLEFKSCMTKSVKLGLGTHLFATVKGHFRSSSRAATCYYQFNHSKVETIPLSALPKDTISKLAGQGRNQDFVKGGWKMKIFVTSF